MLASIVLPDLWQELNRPADCTESAHRIGSSLPRSFVAHDCCQVESSRNANIRNAVSKFYTYWSEMPDTGGATVLEVQLRLACPRLLARIVDMVIFCNLTMIGVVALRVKTRE